MKKVYILMLSAIFFIALSSASRINLNWLNPTSNINVSQNQFFNITVNVSCKDNDCGQVNVTLDPAGTIYNFTTCNVNGRAGPNITQCNSSYTGTSLDNLVGVVSGIQNFTIPTTGTYTIEAAGANGARGAYAVASFGYGAVITGTFSLTAGTVLKILVGQNGTFDGTYAGGGGGGTFVINAANNDPLIIAGGGGGGAIRSSTFSLGRNASTNITGVFGSTDATLNSNAAGSNGLGGSGSNNGGGGGAGILGNGTNPTGSGKGGFAFISGGAGATAATSAAHGGFGGGGSGYGGGGGGGGYNGGGGGGYDGSGGGGGGGSSVNNGTNQNNSIRTIVGNGYVTITLSNPAKSGAVSTTAGATPFYTNVTNPYNLTLNAGQSQTITWYVNATGSLAASTFLIYANQTSNMSNSNITSQLNITIKDTTSPEISILYPTVQTYNTNVSSINYSYSDTNPDSCWYSINSGATNSSAVTAGTNLTNVTSTEGSNTWKVYCNDTSNNQNSASITFTKTTPAISLTMIYPTSNINATLGEFFPVITTISCSNANCGNINVTLDPASQPVSCKEILETGQSTGNGTYTIYPFGNSTNLSVYCDMSTDGGGWTLFANLGPSQYAEGLPFGANALPNKTSIYATNKLGMMNHTQMLFMNNVSGNFVYYFVMNFTSVKNLTERFVNMTASGEKVTWHAVNSSGSTFSGIVNSHRFSDNTLLTAATWYTSTTFSYDDGIWGVANATSAALNGNSGPYLSGSTNPRFGYENANSGDGSSVTDYRGYSSASISSWISNVYIRENVTYASAKSGKVSMTAGATPFYTNITNPYNLTLNAGQSQTITWYVNATGTANNNYTFFIYANITSDLSIGSITSQWNVTIVNSSTSHTYDTIYPSFSDYWDNNATLYDSGIGLFNVTLSSTNGLVKLEINNTNITATNLTSNTYNATYAFTSNGTYAYKWHAWGNGSAGNYNSSSYRYYLVNAADTDNDGLPDVTDTLLYNETNVSTTGISSLNITIGGNSTNQSYADKQEINFYDQNSLILNFSHNFTQSNLDLSKVTIKKSSTYLIVNLSNQLQSSYNKTIYLTDNSFISLCVKDAEISSISEMSANCNSLNETDLTSCLSSNITLNGLSCVDEGSAIKISNLRFSAIRGIQASSSETSPSTGTGGSVIKNYECRSDSDCGMGKYCLNLACHKYECSDNSSCNGKTGEICLNHRCVKLFDMEILEFESPAKLGEFFNFTYLVKAVAEINGDVEIEFWIEKNGESITSGKDTIYMASYEEKTKNKQLFLPSNVQSGTYEFFIKVTHFGYSAEASRTIEIGVNEGLAEISFSPENKPSLAIVISLIFMLFVALSIIAYKKNKNKKQDIKIREFIKQVNVQRENQSKKLYTELFEHKEESEKSINSNKTEEEKEETPLKENEKIILTLLDNAEKNSALNLIKKYLSLPDEEISSAIENLHKRGLISTIEVNEGEIRTEKYCHTEKVRQDMLDEKTRFKKDMGWDYA